MSNFHKLIIIGGGASGLMAAITAKDMGADVAVLEGNDRVGKKILSTGNGRCNITNEFCTSSRYHSNNTDFFTNVLNSFTVKDTLSFFNSLGLPIITLEGGKMYPMSLQASSVLDILRFAVEDREVAVYLNNKVKDIKTAGKKFIIHAGNNEIFECEELILACGGKSAPSTGSDGSGFELCKKLGHSIITPIPSLVQLKLDYKHLKALSGVKFDGYAEILVDSESTRKEYGEILFTDYGISGPPVLQLSRTASYAVSKGLNTVIKVDMIPSMNIEDLKDFFDNRWAIFSYRSVYDSFIGIINKKLISILLKEAEVENIHKCCYELTWKERQNIYTLLKSWSFTVTGTNSFKDSQVTAGGVNTKDINNSTLESKLIPNLYLCGEILDVDGDCGGFNLQWAWSSGFIAAKNACLK